MCLMETGKRYVVGFEHELGRARSYRMTDQAALKMAQDWVRAGEIGVLVEDPVSGEVWTAEQFRAVAS